MTEKDWLSCPVSERLLNHVKNTASQRKLRLYGVAACRRLWALLDGPGSGAVIETAEAFAEGRVSAADLEASRKVAWEMGRAAAQSPADEPCRIHTNNAVLFVAQAPKAAGCWGGMRACAREAVEAAAHGPTWAAAPISQRLDVCDSLRAAEKEAQAGLLRDLFGNPFRPAAILPSWRTTAVLALAQAAYDERNLPDGTLEVDRLRVLADALEEAGCADEEALRHLREPGFHVRGCWVVDGLLGKE